jgi:hypothetical protein
VSGSGNGTVTFTRQGLGNLTWDASHTHTSISNIDDRDVKPSNLSYNRLQGYFTSLEGLTGTAGSDYQDLLVLNTYVDNTGGDVNALAFDKSEKKIRHYLADQAHTTWGTPKTLAYAEDVLPLTGGTLTGQLTVDGLGIIGDSLDGYSQYFSSSTGGPRIEGKYTAEDRYLKLTGDLINLTGPVSTSSSLTTAGNLTVNGDIYGKGVDQAYSNLYKIGGVYFG